MGFKVYNMTLRHIYKNQSFALYAYSKRRWGKTNSQKSLEHIELLTLKNKSRIKGNLTSL